MGFRARNSAGGHVVKLKRGTHTAYSEASSLRLRAAWLYYNEGLTQKDVAEQLGISRTTVIRVGKGIEPKA